MAFFFNKIAEEPQKVVYLQKNEGFTKPDGMKGISCNNIIEAEGFRSFLQEARIESVVYDETNSKVARAVLDQAVDVLVKEENYEKARKLYQTFLADQPSLLPWCPKCGSENVTARQKSSARQLPRFLAALLMFVPLGICNTEKFVCNDCGYKWER